MKRRTVKQRSDADLSEWAKRIPIDQHPTVLQPFFPNKISPAMPDQTRSPHVLNAASNLMGICFLIQTSIRVLGYRSKSYIDECTAAATCFFMLACLFSYLALRNSAANRSLRLERIADMSFLLGLVLLCGMVVTISLVELT
jgi:hypothetical protein